MQRSYSNPRYAFSSVAGHYIVLCFFGSAGNARGRNTIKEVLARRAVFDDERASFFGVSLDPADETEGRVADSFPGLRFFWDFDGVVSKLYGALPVDAAVNARQHTVRRFWLVLDPTLRVIRSFPFEDNGRDILEVFDLLKNLPPPALHAGIEISAPILILPRVFEPEFCRDLIGLYEKNGGEESGFMREVEGKTVAIQDHSFKRRRDYIIEDTKLIQRLQLYMKKKVVPEIRKAHHFTATRMERYIVSCYAAEDRAIFKPHRDNTTKGTAHRRFAVSINLNDDFEGGELSFPEFGPRTYKAPIGCAVVFSTPLLHAVGEVTKGRRYAFLPFLYDDEAAKLREANNAFLGDNVEAYRSS